MKNYFLKNFETFFLFITAFGYIIAYYDIFHSNVISHVVNFLIRATVFTLSVFLVVKNFKNIHKKRTIISVFLLFYVLYIFKFIYTLYFYQFNADLFEKIKLEFIFYGLIVIPVPVLALMTLDYHKVNFNKLYKFIFYFLFIMLGLASVIINGSLLFNKEVYWIFRSYYILHGHYGVSLLILCLVDLFFVKLLPKQYVLLAMFVSIYHMYYSSARSPVLAAAVVYIIILLNYKNSKQWYLFFGLVFSFLIILFLANYFQIDSNFFQRNYNAIFKGDASGRSYYLNKGVEEFLKNPIIGGRTLFEDGNYSHNMFLDILMSTGIVGFTIMFFYYKILFSNVFTILKNIRIYKEISIFALFFIQYFILNQTSGCVYLGFQEWYFGAIVIGLINSKNYEKT